MVRNMRIMQRDTVSKFWLSSRACLLVLALAGVSSLLSGCTNKAQPSFDRPPAPVSVQTAVAQDVPTYLDAIGKTVAREVVSIQPQVSGRITKIHCQAEANLKRDIAQAQWGNVQVARYKDLVDHGVIPREQYDQLKTNAESLDATVDADRAAVKSADETMKVDAAAIESAKVQLSYCYIRSPIDGRAGQRLVDLGNVVSPGGTSGSSASVNNASSTQSNGNSMLVIQRLDPIYADFTISQNNLAEVQDQMRQGTLKAEVRLADEPSDPMIGQLTFLDNSVQNQTGTVNLRATIANGGHRFWPGRFVNIRLVLSTIHGAVLVSASAPQMSGKGSFVYVVKPDSTAEQRPVSLGQRQGDLIVVEKGIEAGERVVINGQLGVTPGGKVRVEQPANAGGAANGAK